jgi:hypothetical protein
MWESMGVILALLALLGFVARLGRGRSVRTPGDSRERVEVPRHEKKQGDE